MKLLIFLLIIIIVFQSKLKQQITGQTGNGETKTFEIIVPLKNLSNFWSTLEMPWINCEFSLQLKCSKNCILGAGIVAKSKFSNKWYQTLCS